MNKLFPIILLLLFIGCDDDPVSPNICNIKNACDLSENSLMMVNIDSVENSIGEIWYNFDDIQGVDIVIEGLSNPNFQINSALTQFVAYEGSAILNDDELRVIIAFNNGINSCGLLGVVEESNNYTSIVDLQLVNSSGLEVEPNVDCP